MIFTFLGTGTSQGIPVIGCTCKVCTSTDTKNKRLRCAAIVQEGDTQLLIDSGPDIRTQLLTAKITKIDAALITHEHYDHIGGLDDLRPIGFEYGGIHIYALDRVLEQIKLKYDYAFGEQKYPGAPKFHLHEIQDQQNLLFGSIKIVPLTIQHGHLLIVGYLINNKLMYITDANGIPSTTLDPIQGVDTLVINALHHNSHHSHFTLAESLKMIEYIKPKKAYLIHMSHHMGLADEVEKLLPFNVYLGFDGLQLEI